MYHHGLAYLGQLVNINAQGSNVLDFDQSRLQVQIALREPNLAKKVDDYVMFTDNHMMARIVETWKVTGNLPGVPEDIRPLLDTSLAALFQRVNASRFH